MAVGIPLEPPVPPDCYAAHLAEFPEPGSRVFDGQNALALALIYNCMDPDHLKELENLREDVRSLSDQNQNLNAYAQMVYFIANKLRVQLATVMEHNAKVEAELKRLKENDVRTASELQLQHTTTALQNAEVERNFLRVKVHDLERKAQLALQNEKRIATLTKQVSELRAQSADPNCSQVQPFSLSIRNAFPSLEPSAPPADQANGIALHNRVLEAEAEHLRLQTSLTTERSRHAAERRAATLDQGRLGSMCVSEQQQRAALGRERGELLDELTAHRSDCAPVADERDRLRGELDASQALVGNLQAKLVETTQECGRLHDELRTAEKNVRDWESKCAAAQESGSQQLNQLRSQAARSETQSAAARQERDEVQAELTALQKAADDQRTQLQSASQECEKLKDEASSLRGSVADLNAKLQKVQQVVQDGKVSAERLTELESERDALASVISTLRDEREIGQAAEQQVETLTKTADRLSGKLETALEELAESVKTLQERETELERLSENRTFWEDTADGWKSEYDRAQMELENRQTQMSSLQADVDLWKKEHGSTCKERVDTRETEKMLSTVCTVRDALGAQLKAERERVRTERDRFQSEQDKFRTQLESSRRASSAWQPKYDTAVHALNANKTEAEKKMSVECTQLQKAVASLRSESSALQTKLAAALRENRVKDSQIGELPSLRTRREQLETALHKAKERVKELEKSLEAGKKGCEDIIEKYDNLRATAKHLEDKLALASGEHTRASGKAHALERSLKAATADIGALKSQVAELNETLQRERKRPGSQREVNELRVENDRLCAQIDELEKANSKLETNLARGPTR
ncbi:hypothetical protein AURDEDRAFT_184901 [Auricularia subglabra TFB-10046 SS5]|nr:hypothetical protein AURDEDRAFT_184901 [Auricularia subglabra TFB-10046 SS5]